MLGEIERDRERGRGRESGRRDREIYRGRVKVLGGIKRDSEREREREW